MMRMFTILFYAITLILFTILAIFITLVHPNPNRLEFSHKIRPNGSDPFNHIVRAFDVEHRSIYSSKQNLKKLYKKLERRPQEKGVFISKSKRFRSSYQSYLSVGSYPEIMVGYDAAILDKGGEFVVSLPDGAKAAEFHIYPIDSQKVTVLLKDSDHSKRETVKTAEIIDTTSLWYHYFLRFWQIKAFYPDELWQKITLPVAEGVTSLSITCEDSPCAISEPMFFLKKKSQFKQFIFILVDTLRYDFASLGHAPQTMNFFKPSSNQGVKFIAPGNMTSPSTNGLLTCKKPSSIPNIAFTYEIGPEKRETHYKLKEASFPALFQNKGYKTSMIGNISILSEVLGNGVNHGFDEHISLEKEGYDTLSIGQLAADYIQTNKNKPFFLYVHFNGPHGPYKPPLSYLLKTYFPHAFASRGHILRWLYQGEINYTDEALAYIYKAISQLNSESVITSLVADHGDFHNERLFLENSVNHPQRGAFYDHGGTLFNDEVAVPLLLKLPPTDQHILGTQAYRSTLDLGPTLLDVAGIDAPEYCSGSSLFKESKKPITTEGFRAKAIIFDQRYKYIRTMKPTTKDLISREQYRTTPYQTYTFEQLYDLKQDPQEENSLTYTQPKLLHTARLAFQKAYDMTISYRIFLPLRLSKYTIKVNGRAEFRCNRGCISSYDKKQNITTIYTKGSKHIDIHRGTSIPQIYYHQNAVNLGRFTSYELPLDSSSDLPTEIRSIRENTTSQSRPVMIAYEFYGDEPATISAGNVAIERILRSWGYLNDN